MDINQLFWRETLYRWFSNKGGGVVLTVMETDMKPTPIGRFTDAPSYEELQREVARLRLTDEEREAIAWAISKTAQAYDDPEGGPIKREAMRGLLARHGPCRSV
jgi:hypothetical protein